MTVSYTLMSLFDLRKRQGVLTRKRCGVAAVHACARRCGCADPEQVRSRGVWRARSAPAHSRDFAHAVQFRKMQGVLTRKTCGVAAVHAGARRCGCADPEQLRRRGVRRMLCNLSPLRTVRRAPS